MILPLLAVPFLLLLRRKKGSKMAEQNRYQLEKNFREIKDIFGVDITREVEKIYRLETANFSSGGFFKTFSAGMEATQSSEGKFPYGWTSLRKFWNEQPKHAPIGIIRLKEGKGLSGKGGAEKMFIKFPDLFSAMFVLAKVIHDRGGDSASWYSRNEADKVKYHKLLNAQSTAITDKISKG